MEIAVIIFTVLLFMTIKDVSDKWLELKYTDKKDIDKVVADISKLKEEISKIDIAKYDTLRSEINQIKLKTSLR